MVRKRFYLRAIAIFFLINITIEIFAPAVSYALTSGPAQPEFSSFEPVATTNMVNTFTGDFTYNLPVLEVPGPHGSGYPLSLSYHSGLAPEEEASWVGYGFSLNAGAINRSTRGFPDDYNGESVTYYNKMPKNWTATLGGSVGLDIFGKDDAGKYKKVPSGTVSATATLRYNNYRGFGKNAGIGVALGRGLVSMGYNLDNGGKSSFSLDVNPMVLLTKPGSDNNQAEQVQTEQTKWETYKKNASNMAVQSMVGNGNSLVGSAYGILSISEGQRPSLVQGYTGKSFNVSVGLSKDPLTPPVGVSTKIFGSYSSQKNIEETTANAYGFMYSAHADNAETDIMDYHVEKESNFNKRDVFLGVPFNDADIFSATGEGITGSFRLYHRNIGNFGPRNVTSTTKIINIAPELRVGGDNGPGYPVGSGKHELSVKDWDRRSEQFSDPDNDDIDEPVFFRFTNDMGGSWGDQIDDKPFRSIPVNDPILPSGFYNIRNGKRSGRSSYIGYNSNADMTTPSAGKYYKAYSKREDLISTLDRSDPDAIGELAVYNESGSRYVYALPVRSRNEYRLSHGLRGAADEDKDHNHLIYYKNKEGKNEVKVGTFQPEAYASAYLLTEITTPDYVDRSLDGPTPDDFGGYTRFNYDRAYGGGDWYQWRSPYAGLSYQRNSFSDQWDDLGSMSRGEKEIYYLNSIETKTHIAVFDTESEDRDGDGLGANDNEDAAVKDDPFVSSQKLRKLKKIKLYSRGALKTGRVAPFAEEDFVGAPIKTVHFEYAGNGEELMTGAPNNSALTRGKLTLKKVYFTYNDFTPTRLRPYIFDYQYPQGQYPDKYSDLDNYASGTNQNPPYSVHNSDAWSNYQPDGVEQHDNFRTWLNQTLEPNIDFDPAAWHLKQITLPSGGQIHIQYESDDYNYVQDEPAHVMIPVVNPGTGVDGQISSFELDVEAIGFETDDLDKRTEQVNRLVEMIDERYVGTNKKIYFKFLYRLKARLGFELLPPDVNSCNAEYITGYAEVAAVSAVNDRIAIALKNDNDHKIPGEVCSEFFKTQRRGMLGNQDCNVRALGPTDSDKPEEVVLGLLNFKDKKMVPGDGLICRAIAPDLSYFRVPTPLPKRGGGLRVKRLLTFDNTLQGTVLYGNEYIYKTLDEEGREISSGVATNEPASMREENILVDYVKRKGQNAIQKLLYGEDKKQSEGPIGESIMPGPGVGYSKVITKNIHQGITTTGYSVSDYYTARDYPVRALEEDRTSIDDSRQKNKIVYTGIINKFLNHQYATQGFRFVMNNMHGQNRRMATYAGRYIDLLNTKNSPPVTEQINTFYEPGEPIPLMNELYGEVVAKNPGREVDITIAQKNVEETSRDASVNIDATLGLAGPLPIPWLTSWPSINTTEGKLLTHTTVKVIRYPAILKQTKTYQDGIYHTSQNVAFSESTGQPVAVKSYDEFAGAYLSQQIPAEWEYRNFRQKAQSEGLIINSEEGVVEMTVASFFLPQLGGIERFSSATVEFSGQNGCEAMADLNLGDMVELSPGSLHHIVGINYAKDRITIRPSSMNSIPLFLGGDLDRLTIIRSGRNNNLNQLAGGITFHDSDQSLMGVEGLERSGSDRYILGVDPADPIPEKNGSLFIEDINSAFGNITSGIDGSFNLSGPYENMNVSAYTVDCDTDVYAATISDVYFDYYFDEGSVKLVLKRFCIECNDLPNCLIIE